MEEAKDIDKVNQSRLSLSPTPHPLKQQSNILENLINWDAFVKRSGSSI